MPSASPCRWTASLTQWHIDQATACGATSQEILEAVDVGIEMGAGRVTVSARFALDVMERAFSPKETPRAAIEHEGRSQ